MWRSIQPLLQAMAADASRFEGVTILGVDEHVWHHVRQPIKHGGRGPKELTGMVDLTRDRAGRTRARLLDLVPGRSGTAYADWLNERGERFRAGVEVATLDPFHGYKNAIDDQLRTRRRPRRLPCRQARQPRRRRGPPPGPAGDPRPPRPQGRPAVRDPDHPALRPEKLTDRQRARLDRAIAADERHDEVHVAWQCAQQLRAAYHQDTPPQGRRIAEKVLASFPSCPIPEIARLGRTLKQWREPFLAYFDTGGANNGGTEAINGLIELHRRVARGFRNRDNYRLRMLLIGGGLSHPRMS